MFFVLGVCTAEQTHLNILSVKVLQYSYTYQTKNTKTRTHPELCLSVLFFQKKLKAEAKKAIGQLQVRTLRQGDQVHHKK